MNHPDHSHPEHSAHTIPSKHSHEIDEVKKGINIHEHHHVNDFKQKFYVTLIVTIPVILLSPMIQHWMGIHFVFPGDKYVLFLLSTFVFFYGGSPFLKGLLTEVRGKAIGMMTLIAVAITVAYTYSVAVVFGLSGMDFFWELCTLILIMLLGHWIEMKSIAGASRELELLVQLMPSNAHLLHDTHIMDVAIDKLNKDDVVLVKPGEKIPADGVIIEGESYLNESMLTGESVPVRKAEHDSVIAGSINGNGSLKVKVSHSSKDSYLSRVIKLVNDAQKSKSRTQLLADTAAKWLTIIALVSGSVTFMVWMLNDATLAFAIERTVTVIVICCPHALGLAVPVVVAHSTAISAKNGLLIKNRTAFENSRKISTVVFDKTGTLTVGKFQVSRFGSLSENFSDEIILKYASALEQNSEHPIATGIVMKAGELKLSIPAVDDFQALTGKGIQGIIGGKKVLVVSPKFIRDNNIPGKSVDGNDRETVVYVLIDGNIAGYVALADEIREESAGAIRVLHKHNIKSILLTGDNAKVAESVSSELRMDGYFAEVLPHQKLDKVKELQSKGEFVAMTGDGVNDAPALAQADVGIAVGSGSDIAAETAGIILVNSNPKDISSLILFGRATYKKMIQNLIWATGYNVIALPLAAGVLHSIGILLSPAAGAILMSLSTIVVAVNARLLNLRRATS